MKFELRTPCKDCPFRTDVTPYLTRARVREITDAITEGQATFSCHKLNDLVEDEETGEEDVVEGERAQHCAGAMIMLERLGRPNQMMRIAERVGLYDRSKLRMDSPVYATPEAMIKAQRR